MLRCNERAAIFKRLKDKYIDQYILEEGKNGPAQSFPTPLLRRNIQLAKCFLNLNFSLEQDNHECLDTVQE